jgi:hypothetical protein
VRERSSQSVSTHVELEEHACVFEDRVEKDRRRSRRLSKCLKGTVFVRKAFADDC